MKFISLDVFPDVLIIEPDVYPDQRGLYWEIYQANKYTLNGISQTFVQDNVSYSKRGVIRGLHYQLGKPQAKLVMVIDGEIFDVVVDIRKGSPTFGKWAGVMISSDNHRQVFVPEGFAHGYCVLSETTRVLYKCTDYYDHGEERGILWNDSSLNIGWPVVDAIVSEKDMKNPQLKSIQENDLPVYKR